MKRRLLSAFLAVMMVLTMAPVALRRMALSRLTALVPVKLHLPRLCRSRLTRRKNGATITLNDNYTEDITIPADKVITLNLNDKKLTNVQSDTITVTKGAKLTIEGAGTVDNVTHAPERSGKLW